MKPDTHSARAIVAKAIRDGILTPQPCRECGTSPSEAHHEDYSKPLDVVWLCRKHHALRHGEFIRAANGFAARIVITLPEELLRLVDAYWHERRLPKRTTAIRELLAYALDAKLAKQDGDR